MLVGGLHERCVHQPPWVSLVQRPGRLQPPGWKAQPGLDAKCLAAEVLEALAKRFGEPQSIRSDNGPEFIARDVQEWAHSSGIEWKFIQPGKPAQNGYIERFNGTFRTEVLDICAFSDLEESQLIAEQWRRTYNNDRPHQALDNLPHRVFLENWQANSLY